MPVEIRLLNDGLGMLQLQSGILLESEEKEYLERFYRDPTVSDQIRFNIIDSSRVVKTKISNQYAVQQARWCEELAQRKPNNIVALVCPDDASFGMARMWETYTSDLGWKTMAFRDLDNALEWVKNTYAVVYGESLDVIIETSVAIPEINHSK